MRIVIDYQGAQSSFSKTRGVGRYTSNVTRELILLASSKHEIIVILNPLFDDTINSIKDSFKSLLPEKNIRLWRQPFKDFSGIAEHFSRRIFSELSREVFINSLNPDIVWCPNLQEGWNDFSVTSVKRIHSNAKFVTTLHDVIPLIFKDFYLGGPIGVWYNEKIEHTLKSDLLVTVSDYSKQQINTLLNFPLDKIIVTPNASNVSSCAESGYASVYPPYVLHVGGVDKHKNVEIIIQALSRISELDLCLVIAGQQAHEKSHEICAYAEKVGLDANRIIFTGFVSDNDLVSLYRHSKVFLAPSLSEGFGIPVLEAMSLGVPVLASNGGTYPELIKLQSALFDPTQPDQLKNKIINIICDEDFRKIVIDNGLQQAQKYSWHKSAAQLLSAFEDLVISRNIRNINIIDSALCEVKNLLKPIRSSLCGNEIATFCESLVLNDRSKKDTNYVFIDISVLVNFDFQTGIQRVTRAITNGLRKLSTKRIKFVPVYSTPEADCFCKAHIVGDQFKKSAAENIDQVFFTPGDILLFLDLHPGNAISKRDLIRNLRQVDVKVIFTVYDLLPVSLPHHFEPELVAEFGAWLDTVVLSDGAVCISRATKNELRNWIQNNKKKICADFFIEYFHLGSDISNSMPSTGINHSQNAILSAVSKLKTFLMVGTVEPRKGHRYVLSVFEKLWAEGLNVDLMIVGKEGWKNQATIDMILKSKHYNEKLVWVKDGSDEFLEAIYTKAACLIAASDDEGFGLPLIEAAKHGLPVICRDIPVFREVAEDHAFYFHGEEEGDLYNTITDWIKLRPAEGVPLSSLMKMLTWDDSAKRVYDIILTHYEH